LIIFYARLFEKCKNFLTTKVNISALRQEITDFFAPGCQKFTSSITDCCEEKFKTIIIHDADKGIHLVVPGTFTRRISGGLARRPYGGFDPKFILA